MSMMAAPAPEVMMAMRCGTAGAAFLCFAGEKPLQQLRLELLKGHVQISPRRPA